MARRGHDVHLMEPVPRGVDPETPAGVRRHPCPRLSVSPEAQAPLWLAFGVLAVLRARPHVVWALKALPNSWIPARLAWLGGARFALDIDDLDDAYTRSPFARALLALNFRLAVAAADDVTVHTEPLRARVASMRAKCSPPVFVDQGIEVERFAAAREMSTSPEALERRATLDLGPGPVLLYAGHLGPASNLAPLLPALRIVAERHPRARLLVIGDGREAAAIEASAERCLPAGFALFAGSVAHRDAPAYFTLADVALNYLEANEANRHRASIKVREALAAGVPVVTTRTPDTERFAAYVRLVDPGPPVAFVQAVLDELETKDRARARAGGIWLREHGTHDVAVRAIAEQWEAAGANPDEVRP